MNLKEAARTLGVHYQTAYKWVRSGELAAVRIGGRYDVSPAAIDRLQAGRRFVSDDLRTLDPPGPRRRRSDIEPEDLLEELEAMAADPILAVGSLASFVARRTSQVLGDTCLVAVDDPAGTRHAVLDHPRADRSAFYNAIVSLNGPRFAGDDGYFEGALRRGESVLVPIVDQVRMRRSIRPELQQYLEAYAIHSVVAAPVLMDGTPRGFVLATRDEPGGPYGADDLRFVERLAARVAVLIRTAGELEQAWEIRRRLVDVVAHELGRRPVGPSLGAAELRALLFGSGTVGAEAPLPSVVATPDNVIRGVNEALARTCGLAPDAIVGTSRDRYVTAGERSAEQREFDRLFSGEVDYLDSPSSRIGVRGEPVPVVVHRAVVRSTDASAVCFIAVWRPLHLTSDGTIP